MDEEADRRSRRRRRRNMLLTAAALSAGSMMVGCGSQQGGDDDEVMPLPGNPKGSGYDDNVYEEPDAGATTPDPNPDGVQGQEPIEPVEPGGHTGPVLPLPANPKGALYDDGAYEDDETGA